jgi:DNA-binding transcriptional MerR regulator
MTKIPADLDGARLNVSRTAELISMEAGHFRRLVRRGVFPTPKRTSKGMPYFDHELLRQIGQVLKSGVGLNNEEISFYRRKPKQGGQRSPKSRQGRQQATKQPDAYLAAIVEGCRQVGVRDELLDTARITSILSAEFAEGRPELERALPVVARRLLAGE